MKTRRNHRKTTTGRHRRVVKQQRGKTHNYHHRKGTVSSGRRHKFFKRGGEPPIDPTIQAIIDGVENTVKTKLGLTSDDKLKLVVERISYDDQTSRPITSTPLLFHFQDKKIKFVIVAPLPNSILQSVYIYMYDTSEMKYILYGKVMVTIGIDNMGSYHESVSTVIFNAINSKPDFQQYKQK